MVKSFIHNGVEVVRVCSDVIPCKTKKSYHEKGIYTWYGRDTITGFELFGYLPEKGEHSSTTVKTIKAFIEQKEW